jgi:hypothetical protein
MLTLLTSLRFTLVARLLVVSTSLLFAHSAAAAIAIRGTITTVTPASGSNTRASIFITGAQEADTQNTEAMFFVTNTTKIYKLDAAGKRVAATFADLRVGERAEADYTPGPMVMIYPPQGPASEIVILASPPSGSAAVKPAAPAAPTPPPAAFADPVIKAGATVTLAGQLHGGMMAIGGDTTGWQLAYKTSKGTATIEVDVSALKEPKPADGDYVTLTGQIVAKEYIERGTVLILKAATATKIASASGAK